LRRFEISSPRESTLLLLPLLLLLSEPPSQDPGVGVEEGEHLGRGAQERLLRRCPPLALLFNASSASCWVCQQWATAVSGRRWSGWTSAAGPILLSRAAGRATSPTLYCDDDAERDDAERDDAKKGSDLASRSSYASAHNANAYTKIKA